MTECLMRLYSFFGRTQIGVQLAQNGVELLVREGGIHLIGGVHPERKGDRRAAFQLREPLLYIRGIAELPILREGGIRENVNVSGRGRLGPFVRVERLCYAELIISCSHTVEVSLAYVSFISMFIIYFLHAK